MAGRQRLRPSVRRRGGAAGASEPIARPEDVAEAVRRLLERLCTQLEAESLGLRRLLKSR
ncbi:MAG: hypothetical protein NVV74_02210 [Magnetospirillum sp.]|nr:hypothetical protein [Magnetospirillum sp.]